MRREEIGRGGTETIALSRIRDDPGPPFGQGGVELLRAAMDGACPLGASEQPAASLLASVPPVQHPCDPQMLDVIHTDAVVQRGTRLPCVGELLVGHARSIVKLCRGD